MPRQLRGRVCGEAAERTSRAAWGGMLKSQRTLGTWEMLTFTLQHRAAWRVPAGCSGSAPSPSTAWSPPTPNPHLGGEGLLLPKSNLQTFPSRCLGKTNTHPAREGRWLRHSTGLGQPRRGHASSKLAVLKVGPPRPASPAAPGNSLEM